MNIIETETSKTPVGEAGQIITSLINPDWNVAVVGPSESFLIDPGLFMLSHAMAFGNGNLIAIDPKNSRFPKDVQTDDRNRRVVGAGNIDVYMNQLRILSHCGIPLIMPQHTEGAHAMNFYEPNESLHAIMDHNFSPLFPNWGMAGNTLWNKQDDLVALYSSYHRFLAPGGLLILQTNDRAHGFSDIPDDGVSLRSVFRAAGLELIQKLRVQDTYRFHLPLGSRASIEDQIIRTSARWESYFAASGHFETHEETDELIFSLSSVNVQYVCPDMYIAQKIAY